MIKHRRNVDEKKKYENYQEIELLNAYKIQATLKNTKLTKHTYEKN